MTKKILYAEDNEPLRETSVRTLRAVGYFVLPVGDGQAALDAARLSPFDLLITDNDMPRLTGLELVARLRLDGSDLPVIVTSGSTNHFAAHDYEWMRLSAWVQKPFELEDLVTLVRNVFRSTPLSPTSGRSMQITLPPLLREGNPSA